MSDSSDDDCNGELPPEITEAANKAVYQTLPQKSQRTYNEAYITFTTWMKTNKIQNVAMTEKILLAYVTFLSETKKYKPPTIVSIISMIKQMIIVKHDIDISQYKQLQRSLKTCMVGYVAKKSKVLTAENFKNFLENAPDIKYLAAKVSRNKIYEIAVILNKNQSYKGYVYFYTGYRSYRHSRRVQKK